MADTPVDVPVGSVAVTGRTPLPAYVLFGSGLINGQSVGSAVVAPIFFATAFSGVNNFGTGVNALGVAQGISASETAFGIPVASSAVVDLDTTKVPLGLPSTVAFGTAIGTIYAAAAAIPSGGGLGVGTAEANCGATGRASVLAFGTASAYQVVSATGVATSLALGAHVSAIYVLAEGLRSRCVMGSPTSPLPTRFPGQYITRWLGS